MKIDGRRLKEGTQAMLVIALLGQSACSAPPDPQPDDPATTSVQSEVITTPTTKRLIPVRFVQFHAPNAPVISEATYRIRVDELNATYGAAGVQFFYRSHHANSGTGFEVTQVGDQYTWPPTLTSNPPPWPVKDLNCPQAKYTQLLASLPTSRIDPGGKDGGRNGALWRGAAFCAADGEVVIYIVDNRNRANESAFPFLGNTMIIVSGGKDGVNLPLNPGTSAVVHEMGHYLNIGDLSPLSAQQLGSIFWDLIYDSTHNTTFSSAAQAQAWIASGGAIARIAGLPLTGNPHELNIKYCRSGSPPLEPGCGNPISCPGTLNDTGALAVTFGGTTYYSGDPKIKGLAGLSGSLRYVNTMEYSDWCYYPANRSKLKDYLSPSGVEVVSALMSSSVEPPLSDFPTLTGRRSKLGEGMWTPWTAMPSGAYVASRPGVDITPGHVHVTWRNTPPQSTGGILAADCTTTQTGSCTVQGVSVGTQAYQGPSDIALAGTGTGIRTHVIAWASPGADPLFRDRLTTGGSWRPATDWARPTGQFLDALSLTGRANGQIDAAGRGLDNGAYIGTLNADGTFPAGTWWQSMGHTISGPVSIGTRFSDGATIDVVTRDGGNILHRSRDGAGTWTAWTTLFTGTSVSEPGLNERADGEVDVIAMVDSNICFKTFAFGSWWDGGCVPKSGTIVGAPALSIVGNPSFAAWEQGRADMVARASDGSIVYRFINKQTGAWWPGPTQWAKFGSGAASSPIGDPVIAATGVDNFVILTVDGSGNLYYRVRYQ